MEDLEYSDDLALPSHSDALSINDMQKKTQRMEEVAASVGLRINKDKMTIIKVRLRWTLLLIAYL